MALINQSSWKAYFVCVCVCVGGGGGGGVEEKGEIRTNFSF